jgi:DNA-binding NtrC family response regulator
MAHHRQQLIVASPDHGTLQALSRALTQDRQTVTTAGNWSEMMTKVEGESLSVIVYDVMDLNEKERKRLLSLRAAHPGVSTILLASLESPGLHQAIIEGLIAAYLMKPISLTALEECLDALWTQRQMVLA